MAKKSRHVLKFSLLEMAKRSINEKEPLMEIRSSFFDLE